MKEYVYFDIDLMRVSEKTVDHSNIIAITAVSSTGRKFHSTVRTSPRLSVSEFSVEKTGITAGNILDSKWFDAVYDDLVEFINGCDVVVWGNEEINVMYRLCKKFGKEPLNIYANLESELISKVSKFQPTTSEICEIMDIEHRDLHRACTDSNALRELHSVYLNKPEKLKQVISNLTFIKKQKKLIEKDSRWKGFSNLTLEEIENNTSKVKDLILNTTA